MQTVLVVDDEIAIRETLAQILGHKSTMTTLIYIGAPEEAQRQAMAKIYENRQIELEKYLKSIWNQRPPLFR